MKTERGFEKQCFKDDYGVDCSLQESSAIEPHVWLGVHRAKAMILGKDVNNISIKLPPSTLGWHEIELPEEVEVHSRMHLNQEQAMELAKKLMFFAENGCLPDEGTVLPDYKKVTNMVRAQTAGGKACINKAYVLYAEYDENDDKTYVSMREDNTVACIGDVTDKF